jgi:hypothetical protein
VVVADQALNSQPVVLVVLFVQLDGIIPGHLQMFCEVLVDELCHQILDLRAWNAVSSDDESIGLKDHRDLLRG